MSEVGLRPIKGWSELSSGCEIILEMRLSQTEPRTKLLSQIWIRLTLLDGKTFADGMHKTKTTTYENKKGKNGKNTSENE